MADASKIEWTDATWNPIAGCSPVSPGCTHCYAATMARRLERMGQEKYAGTAERRGKLDVFTGVLRLDESALEQPLKWRKPRRIFVNSMSDLFHENVPDEWIDKVLDVVERCPRHTFQVLTKRPRRMASYIRARRERQLSALRAEETNFSAFMQAARPPNLWLGTSVEDQQRADERIPWLIETMAAVLFVSCEPLLGAVAMGEWFIGAKIQRGYPPIHSINWVIAGGESGPRSRPMHPEWLRGLRGQCQAARVPFFFKQWGEWQPLSTTAGDQQVPFGEYVLPTAEHDGFGFLRVGKKKAGRTLDGREWSEFPQ